MEDSDGVGNKLIENLLLIRNHFIKVEQQCEHDSVPLLMGQLLVGTCASTFEIPLEKAEGR